MGTECQSLSDNELLRRLTELTKHSRRVEAELVAHIAEVDARRLYLRQACPSMFVFCTDVLHLSEAEAYLRIAVARAAREHPQLVAMLADGRLHLSAIARLAPHLTRESRDAVLARAVHRSKRELEELVVELSPRPEVRAEVRRLPDRRLGAASAPQPVASGRQLASGQCLGSELFGRPPVADGGRLGPSACDERLPASRPGVLPLGGVDGSSEKKPARIECLAPGRYKVQFTAGAGFREKLERLQALMRGSIPDGDLAAVIETAVSEKLERLEARRFARTAKPRKTLGDTDTSPSSRYVPAAVRRAVRERDGDRCRYVDAQGRRCTARERLEFHHRRPFGYGGTHEIDELRLVCRAHNQYLAEIDYGGRTRNPTRRSGPSARPGAPEARPGAREVRPDAREARPGVREARPDAREVRPGVPGDGRLSKADSFRTESPPRLGA